MHLCVCADACHCKVHPFALHVETLWDSDISSNSFPVMDFTATSESGDKMPLVPACPDHDNLSLSIIMIKRSSVPKSAIEALRGSARPGAHSS